MGNCDLESRVRVRLEDLANTQLLRTLQAPSGKDFSSNDYLGLAASKQLHDAMILGVQQEGCGSTGLLSHTSQNLRRLIGRCTFQVAI